MKLYVVRHGQTNDNVARTVATSNSSLSGLGIKQAESVGLRLKDIHFDKIYISDTKRAVDTATQILEYHNSAHVYTPLLREHKKPSEILSLEHESEEAQKVYREIEAHVTDLNWHYSDEENFFDFRTRLLEFLDLVESELHETSLAVSHSLVIRMLACLVIFGRDLTPEVFEIAKWNFETVNTGVSIFVFEKDKWKLLTYNDIAHLAE